MRTADATLAQRAHAAASIASQVARSTDIAEDELSSAVCELYRQSIYWSLLALGDDPSEPSASGGLPNAPAPSNVLDSTLLRTAIARREERPRLQRALESLTFVDLATMAAEERTRLGKDLRRLALALVDEAYFSQRVREAV